MKTKPALILVALFLLEAIPAGANPAPDTPPNSTETTWMALLVGGARAGHVKSTREVFPAEVHTTEGFYIRINRGAAVTEIQAEDRFVETLDGQPLGFRSSLKMSGTELTTEGEIRDGRAYATTFSAGTEMQQEFDWPENALLAEGHRLLAQRHGLVPGTRYEVLEFLASELRFAPASVTVGQTETVDLLGTEQQLIRVVQSLQLGSTPTEVISWINPEGQEKKTRMSMMGTTFEAIACPEACATADTEPTTLFSAAIAHSPIRLSQQNRESAITYTVSAASPDTPLFFPQSDEQTVDRAENGDYRISVRRLGPGSAGLDEDTRSAHLQPTRWLQAEAPEVMDLARRARGDETDPKLAMLRLEKFVQDYVNDKNLSVGYASALEVARNRSGDCTEHALLLAAMGRALGIPTRVATGLAYVNNWLGNQHVFVPHAWTQAYIDGRWISFDAALGRFGAGHIALGYGDGEPGSFYDSVHTLGNISIVQAEAH